MKAANFRYERPETVVEALETLAAVREDGRILSGGQSLVPMMNLRLARPEVIIDINAIPGLAGILPSSNGTRIGTRVRHAELERYVGPLGSLEVLREAARHIGHMGIRERGTIGGSIAHADPTAEWSLLAVLLDATATLRSLRGVREVPVAELLLGPYMTAIESDELLVELVFPPCERRTAFKEFAPRHGDFAVVAAGVSFDTRDGLFHDARVVLSGFDAVPIRVPEAEAVLNGQPIDASIMRAAAAAGAESLRTDPTPDRGSHHRCVLAETLVTRALESAGSGNSEEDGPR